MATVVDTRTEQVTINVARPGTAVAHPHGVQVISVLPAYGDGANGHHIPLANLQPNTQKLLRNVKTLASTLAFLAITKNIIILYFFDGMYTNMASMLISVLIPYCGYEGARKRNRAMVTCFWGCNAFSVINFMLQAYWAINAIAEHENDASEFVDLSSDQGRLGTFVILGLSVLIAIFQILGCYYGRSLAYSEAMLIVDPGRFGGNGDMFLQGGIVRFVQPGAGAAQTSQVPHGVDPAVLAGLPTETLTEAALSSGDWDVGGKNSVCVICLDEFSKGDKLKVLPCKHQFHVACIDAWLADHDRCPICNYKFADV